MKFTARFKVTREYSTEIEAADQKAAEEVAEKLAKEGGLVEGSIPTDGCEEEEIEVLDVEAQCAPDETAHYRSVG